MRRFLFLPILAVAAISITLLADRIGRANFLGPPPFPFGLTGNGTQLTGNGTLLRGYPNIWQASGGPNCNSGVSLSNGSQNATVSAGGTWKLCRGTRTYNAGTYYFFQTIVARDAVNGWMGGIANAAASVSSYPGVDLNGVGFQAASSGSSVFYLNAVSTNVSVAPAVGTVVRFDVDLTNKQLGVNVGGTEYPSGCVITTPSGCFSFASWNGGDTYVAWAGFGNSSVADTSMLNAQIGTGPGGSFVLWR